MSRAFVTDKEDWVYCPKAGERCMHAAADRSCGKTECEFFRKEVKAARPNVASVKVVKRQPKEAKEAKNAAEKKSEPRRATKKASLKKPKKWGGRSSFSVK